MVNDAEPVLPDGLFVQIDEDEAKKWKKPATVAGFFSLDASAFLRGLLGKDRYVKLFSACPSGGRSNSAYQSLYPYINSLLPKPKQF